MNNNKISSNSQFKVRSDKLAKWEENNPVLLAGEPSVVTDGFDTERIKIGDGVTAWRDLPYWTGAQGIDTQMSDTSDNAIANRVVKDYIDNKILPAADYIVESGTSGIWTYRKWNSGIAECWGSVYIYTKISKYFTEIGQHLYYSDKTFTPIAYPISFISAPNVNFNIVYATSNFVDARIRQFGNYTTQTPEYWATSPWSRPSEIDIGGCYYVNGRWK